MTTVLEATDNKLQLQRTFAASIERVWAAWTDPNQVYRWFGCPESQGLGAEIDLQVGGAFNVTLIAHGGQITMKGKIAELERKSRLAIDWQWEGEEAMSDLPPTRLEIDFKEVSAGTQITLTHSGFPNAEACNEHQRGWSASLERIDAFTDSAEAEIFEAITAWERAVWNKDSEGIVDDYVADATLFDIGCQTDSAEATKKLWEMCFPYFEDHIEVQRKDVKIHVNGDNALMTCLSRCKGMKMPETGEVKDMMKSWFRVSVFYQKIDGRWKVIHEHLSMPIDCMNEKPAYILD